MTRRPTPFPLPFARPRPFRCAGLAVPLFGIAALSSCAIGPMDVLKVSEAQIAAEAPVPLRALYEGAVRGTVVGVVNHPVGSTSAGVAAVRNRTRELFPVEVFLGAEQDAATLPPPGSEAFESRLDSFGMRPRNRGTVDFLIDGPSFFPRLKEAIDEAEHSIDWAIYIFDNDDYAVEIADRLKRRSAEVPVRVLTDRLGSVMAGYSPPDTPFPEGFVPPRSIEQYLKLDSSVRVRKQPNPWLVSDHTKLLMFDRRVAFLGGMNIGREYRSEWHDLMVELRGPVVGELGDHFEDRWRLSGWFGEFTRPTPPGPAVPDVEGSHPIRILETAPWRYEIERAQLEAIRASRKRIVVMTPYFTSDAMMVELRRAARRGVDVSVVLPSRNDSGLMDMANWDTGARLAEDDVKIYFYDGLMHLKAAVYDSWVCLGSANMDTLSLRINREVNIAFSDPRAVARFEREIVAPDLRRSRRVLLPELLERRAAWIKPLADQL